ncbi:MAG: hypothetical protein ABR950_06260 [Candidatus Dormibacteria bacterium]|jgi:hypothetical protein
MPISELPALTAAPRLRIAAAIGLGTLSIVGSLVLVVTDGINSSISWSHHTGLSAAPLLLVAGAIAATSVAHPPAGRRLLLRVVAIMAFTAWGLSQLLTGSTAAGLLDDAAILLFVLEAGATVIWDGLTRLRGAHASRPAPPGPT